MAGCRLAWPDACRRWLPVWLPGTGGRGRIEASQVQNADLRPLGHRTGHRAQRPRPDPASVIQQYQAAADDDGAGLTHHRCQPVPKRPASDACRRQLNIDCLAVSRSDFRFWHSFREVSGVRAERRPRLCDHAGRALLMLLMICCRNWRMCWLSRSSWRAGSEQGRLKSKCPRLVCNPRCGCLAGLAGWHKSGRAMTAGRCLPRLC
jgi:hypothetical protein